MARKQQEGGAKNKIYFTTETEKAIIRYNESPDADEREILYKNHIAKPIDKLAENVINRWKFPYLNQSFDDTKRQVVSFLVINLAKYTQDKGKAFSYLSVIAKNYLILHNSNAYKQEKRSVSLSDGVESFIPIEDATFLEAPDARQHDDSTEFVQLMIAYWEKNVKSVFKKKRDADIANAVIWLFLRSQTIENFNKKALYLSIREITNCETSYITKVVNKMRDITAEQLQCYYEYGTLDSEDVSIFDP